MAKRTTKTSTPKASARQKPRVLAIAAHPDDIEFAMAGTLLRLRDAGWEPHYLNIANGSCGTAEYTRDQIVRMRRSEAEAAAKLTGMVFHPPFVDDLMVYHTPKLVSQVCAVVRKVNPTIVLTQSPADYMEDHMNACRVAVTATFCKGMQNFPVIPKTPAADGDVVVYHALPHGLRDGMRRRVLAEHYVDVEPVLQEKWDMLGCHKSQKNWLDRSQGMDSYLKSMRDAAQVVGKASKAFRYAEGWRRHSNLGYAAQPGFDPLADALRHCLRTDKKYQTFLDA